MKFCVKSSGQFAQMLQRIRKESSQPIAARIVVPPDLRWWVYQEWGTATRGEAGKASGHAYNIFPVRAKMLSWPGADGSVVFRHSVINHPGIRPRHMVLKALPEIESAVTGELGRVLKETGYDFNAAKVYLLDVIMPKVKQLLVESFERELPGTRVDGKLGGTSAAEAFNAGAEIVDTSGQ